MEQLRRGGGEGVMSFVGSRWISRDTIQFITNRTKLVLTCRFHVHVGASIPIRAI
jgi:hypothetical protein